MRVYALYPKRRHDPLPPDTEPETPLLPELDDEELIDIGRRREEFLAIMPQEDIDYFKSLLTEGVIDGWHSLIYVRAIDVEGQDKTTIARLTNEDNRTT